MNMQNFQNPSDCGCRPIPAPLTGLQKQVVAMGYVPWQTFTQVYELDNALQVGTIFPELNKPFLRGKGGCR